MSLLPPNIIATNRWLSNPDNPGQFVNIDACSRVEKYVDATNGLYQLVFVNGTVTGGAWTFSTETKLNTAYSKVGTYLSVESITT